MKRNRIARTSSPQPRTITAQELALVSGGDFRDFLAGAVSGSAEGAVSGVGGIMEKYDQSAQTVLDGLKR